jgi:hypothetical protein
MVFLNDRRRYLYLEIGLIFVLRLRKNILILGDSGYKTSKIIDL